MTIPSLPHIMVAPNGARRTKSDHEAVPVEVMETVAAAKECFEAGARGIHAHVRDKDQKHVLDAGLYQELLDEMAIQLPEMMVQITTEAVGIYSAEEQRKLVYDLKPKAISFALKEMLSDNNVTEAERFYHWAYDREMSVQHILYSAEELEKLLEMHKAAAIPGDLLQVLFVLGRYTKGQVSGPSDLDPFLGVANAADVELDWAVCAFGEREIDCLATAHKRGGKMRIGFENSIWNPDGSIAKDNAERVRLLKQAIQ